MNDAEATLAFGLGLALAFLCAKYVQAIGEMRYNFMINAVGYKVRCQCCVGVVVDSFTVSKYYHPNTHEVT